MNKAKKIILIINIILIVSVILRFCLFIAHLNHDCTHDDNCPVCTLIYKLNRVLTMYKPNNISLLLNVVLIFILLKVFFKNLMKYEKSITLINLKVELLN